MAELGAKQIRLLDSLNFLVMPLAKMPKTFGMIELKKGYFPHFFNIAANQSYMGPIPAPNFYGYDSMTEIRRQDFLTWHAEQRRQNVKFNFKRELIDYCRSDLDILRRCCERFRDDFFELNQLDPFRFITIVQASVWVFSTPYLQPKSIGIIPPGGYRKKARQSHAAEVWLQYLMCSDPEGSTIRHTGTTLTGNFVSIIFEWTVTMLNVRSFMNFTDAFGTGVKRVFLTGEMNLFKWPTDVVWKKIMLEPCTDVKL